ncbi:MAG: hypothetical protein ABSB35_06835 [Bryobacteraceae bacterium]|jgi:site-specific DNA-adenine methylase
MHNSKIESTITNLDFAELIAHGSEEKLIYADPPYLDEGGLSRRLLTEADHIGLAESLRRTKHVWLLT